jgi:hypothetical protein
MKSSKLKYQKTNNAIGKWVKQWNKQFSNEEVQMANKYMKTCSTSLTLVKEMQSKTTLRFQFLPAERQSSRKRTTKNAGGASGSKSRNCFGE